MKKAPIHSALLQVIEDCVMTTLVTPSAIRLNPALQRPMELELGITSGLSEAELTAMGITPGSREWEAMVWRPYPPRITAIASSITSERVRLIWDPEIPVGQLKLEGVPDLGGSDEW